MISFNNVRRTRTVLLIIVTIVLVPSVMIMGIVLLLKPKDSSYPDCFFNSRNPGTGCYSQATTSRPNSSKPESEQKVDQNRSPSKVDNEGAPDFPVPFYPGVVF